MASTFGCSVTVSSRCRQREREALVEFVQVDGLLANLSAVCLAHDESIDLRYAAFTSLERDGPTPACTALLQQMLSDEALGHAARSVLSACHVDAFQ